MGAAGTPPLTDDVLFLRRIWPKWISVKPGRSLPIRPGSLAFKDGRGEVSLFRADLISIDEIMRDYPDHSLVAVDYRTIRALGLSVVHRPEEGGPAHYVLDPHPTGSQATKLVKAAEWLQYRGPIGREAWDRAGLQAN